MTTISKTITSAVHYGIGANYGTRAYYYTAPLTITNTGFIDFDRNGSAAVLGTGASSLVNDGSIVGAAFAVAGVDITGAGTVINNGLIQGYFDGLEMAGPGSVTNSGSIVARYESPLSGGGGLIMPGGGTFTNDKSGFVNFGVLLNVNNDGTAANATLINAGTITDGVVVNSNFHYNVVTGQVVVDYIGTGTIFDSGTISGGPNSAGIAIAMDGSNEVLVLQSGYVLNGPVIVGGTYPHTLELMSNTGAPVTVNFNPNSFRGFGTVGFYPGISNAGTLALATAADRPGTITGFTAPANVIDLKYISDTGHDATAIRNTGNDQLTVTGDSGSTILQLDPAEDYSGLLFEAVPDAAGTGTDVIPVICFCEGTRIELEDREAPIETLHIGDRVRLFDGSVVPIVWIGQGRVLVPRGRRTAATPVIVRQHALAPNIPNRDLCLTKAHALFIDGVLIPVEFLVNHRSIVWDDRAREVAIYHIELETHAVLVANGAPSESYRDDGNRWLFQNANSGWQLPPKPACAPVLTDGPVVDAVWQRLLERAEPSIRLSLTGDPDLHLLADGRRLDPVARSAEAAVFCLARPPQTLRIVSRAAAPQELGTSRDPRHLGVALRRITLRQGDDIQIVAADHAGLTDGFHAFEAGNGLRWTTGDAILPPETFAGLDGAIILELAIGGTTWYRAGEPRLKVA